MAIELNSGISADVRARFENLDRVNHAAAQALADQYNSGAITADAFNQAVNSSLASYRGITSANEGGAFNASAARFGRVLPFRSESVSADASAALDTTAGLSTVSGPLALDARPEIIRKITAAII